MEDEDSKIRRNLIFVSVLMILVWWLGAPLDKVSEKFFGVLPSGPAFEWRVWLATMVALTYFALRFRFSDEHDVGLKTLGNEDKAAYARVIRFWLAIEVALFTRFGLTPPALGEPFLKLRRQALAGPVSKPGPPTGEEFEIVRTKVLKVQTGLITTTGQLHRTERKYQAQVIFSARSKKTAEQVHETGAGIDFRITPQRRFAALFLSRCWLLVYSKATTSLIAPWALALCAGLIGAFKLAVTW